MKTNMKIMLVSFVFALLMSCGTSNRIVNPSENSRTLDEMVTARQFKIEVERVRPLTTTSLNAVLNSGMLPPGNTGSQINVMGDGSYFKMEGDSVSADLPYFGERQMNGGYNSDSGIKFKGTFEDLIIEKDDAKQRYDIRFQISENSEHFQILLTLFPNLKGTIAITSSQRFAIQYDGQIVAIKE
ncbi:DUF4251 domain-containing protein [Aurantibacter crassamenti]|uniref:DUF4251 domain-containing protein n=1 Tax=Aurantibacter crassamenti TaxID=1837375 RepID=UPI00193A905A|nr:DUF4251 domain-containing protein [Aurantibacter crassamenti]MBM1107199.1 DUF4251 domain-containing protein [Aurantibacter crassamenti]